MRRGLTLIELLVVIAILAILGALFLPRFRALTAASPNGQHETITVAKCWTTTDGHRSVQTQYFVSSTGGTTYRANDLRAYGRLIEGHTYRVALGTRWGVTEPLIVSVDAEADGPRGPSAPAEAPPNP